MSNAGRIPQDWLDEARINETEDSRVVDWFAIALNAEVSIDEEGAVWVGGADGHWLTQEAVDSAIEAIEAGV